MDKNTIDINAKASEIIKQLAKEKISFGDIEKILLFAKLNMRLLIPSKSINF